MTDRALNTQESAITWHHLDQEDHDHGGGATILGFWIYLMSDALIFASLFAMFGVVSTSYAGGPVPRQIFDIPLVALNTALLLASSITFGQAIPHMEAGRLSSTRRWLAVTGLLGAAFVGVELYEFAHLIAEGAGPQRSAFLSAFFTLVGTHGAHVTVGLIWIAVMLVQIGQNGLNGEIKRRIVCLSMFWHFLDIIWIGVFNFVYLYGVIR
ncbi:cytochrome o ubiquinol oxidase subunit III [Methylobacterium variabile]|jgi:cytochrome o ubiquinol oxidase subunit 3|uniref:Cytochrome bo(3) ubiquinol oxidase subunit 3 n=1 Tax=Methylobacterium variabile TaxID=298794 RepID=A0A0J6T2E2_9HYPH|nr:MULTISPECIES: cytochrome o ubiquinol oxidase subunit III [Methylobacterium]KMO41570.1 cytochrome o ubiquinol oxidase subunit III [Methylobacterium variabile]NGM37328.1 cytochrome o ubiquinol oxidase subunit III [Methylobacterium sp. DB0501]UHC20316.1 cytochrome o ubiquinol oxidase subunit III [Methylobacterium currus]